MRQTVTAAATGPQIDLVVYQLDGAGVGFRHGHSTKIKVNVRKLSAGTHIVSAYVFFGSGGQGGGAGPRFESATFRRC